MLGTMIDDKVDHLWSVNKVFDMRVFAGLKHYLMRGLPGEEVRGSEDEHGDGSGEGGKCEIVGETKDGKEGRQYGLAAARALFRWRDDATEAAETKRTGVGLLFWCSMSDNVEAVRELAREAAAQQGGGSGDHRSNETNNILRIHR